MSRCEIIGGTAMFLVGLITTVAYSWMLVEGYDLTYGTCQNKYLETRGTSVLYTQTVHDRHNQLVSRYNKTGLYYDEFEKPYGCYYHVDGRSSGSKAYIVGCVVVPVLLLFCIGITLAGLAFMIHPCLEQSDIKVKKQQ